MRFKVICYVIFIVFLSVVIQAKTTYKIGFIGNSSNANSTNLFDALSIILDDINNNNEEFELQKRFFDDNENLENEIKREDNLIAITGIILEKHKKVLENINNIPVFIVGTKYLSIDDKKNIFRMAPSNIDLAKILCKIQISVLHKGKFAILYSEENDEYLKIAEAYKDTVLKNKAMVDYFRSVDAQRKDFEAILIRLRELKVNTIFFAGGMEQASLIAKQSRKLNVGADFSSTGDICNKEFIKKAKDGSQGTHYVLSTPPSLYSFKKMRSFLEKYNETHKRTDAELPFLFDTINILQLCLKNANKDLIIKCLYAETFQGVTGSIEFDEKGMRKNYQPYFYVIRGKEFLFRKLNAKEKDLFYKMR